MHHMRGVWGPVDRAGLAPITIMLSGALCNANGTFFGWSAHRDVVRQVPVYGILACGMSGLFAAIAGICQAARETQGDPGAGATYELTAIAIVVIGGTNLMGGQGSMLLTLLGALTIGYLEKILSLNAVGEASRLMLTGGIIVAAVLPQRRRAS